MDSLNPTEIKKKPSTMYAMANPGDSIDHQVTYPLFALKVKDSICPQVITPGSANPRKLMVASSARAEATAIVMYRKVKWITLGRMWRKMILPGVAPDTLADSMKVLVLKLMTSARIAREVVGHKLTATPKMMAISVW